MGVFVAAIGSLGTGCGTEFDFRLDDVVQTGTVTLSTQRILVVDSIVELDVRATRFGNEINWAFEGTVSATSAGAADNIANGPLVQADETADAVNLLLTQPQEGLIEGLWTVSVPSQIDVQVLGRGPGQRIEGFEGDVVVDAITGVAVLANEGNVTVRTGGEVLVDSPLAPNSNITVNADGAIQIVLPARPTTPIDALIFAQAGPNAAIVIQHPDLPPWPGGGLPYSATVGRGFSRIEAASRRGNVFFVAP